MRGQATAVSLALLLLPYAPAPAEAKTVGSIDIQALVGEILSSVFGDVGGSPDERPVGSEVESKREGARVYPETHPNVAAEQGGRLPPPPPAPATKSGKASWYGARFAGRKTASGETFDPTAMTTAHKSLPFGTDLEVCRQGRCVRVRVTDRGPYVPGRALDLSRAAFARLAPVGRGVVKVDWRVL